MTGSSPYLPSGASFKRFLTESLTCDRVGVQADLEPHCTLDLVLLETCWLKTNKTVLRSASVCASAIRPQEVLQPPGNDPSHCSAADGEPNVLALESSTPP
jgi:hypothetical protein